MKFLVGIDKYNYTFDASAKEVTISGVTSELQLEQFLLITNVTDNVIIYNFAAIGSGGSLGSLTGNTQTLTLGYDTNAASMSNADDLQIFMQDSSAPSYAIINDPFDKVDITYRSAGNGEGEIDTIIYKSGGTDVATLTLVYDANDELTSITRT